MNRGIGIALAAATLGWLSLAGVPRAGEAAGPAPAARPGLILDAGSLWRCYTVRGTEIVRTAGGELVPVHYEQPTARVVKGKDRTEQLRRHPAERLWPAPPKADWKDPDFDDSGWGLLRGPFFTGAGKGDATIYRSVPVFYLRGKFRVEDPARAGDLKLDLAFHGGAVVFVNGKEVVRKHLPAGELKPSEVAEDYPREVFIGPDGFVLRAIPDAKADDAVKALHARRLRTISGVKVPAALLRKGVNVLAVEIHRAPLPEEFFTAKTRDAGGGYFIRRCGWPRAALASLELSAAPGAAGAVVPNAGLAGRTAGFQLWTQPVFDEASAGDYADPCEPLRALKLSGARNGSFSGQLVAGCTEPIKGLTASCSELKGPGGAVIPSAAVTVRYAADAPPRSTYSGGRPDRLAALSAAAPAEVPLDAGAKAAVQPVWFTVKVPADAKPGDYRGTATVRAGGQKPAEVPVELHVADWRIPDARDFVCGAGLFQSPETLALKYEVDMWSEKHWKLIERSFQLMGEIGCKEVYVPAIRRTHLGNEQSMVRYRREGDKLLPDFAIAEKYLELAAKHLGRPLVVCLYCWEHTGTGHFPSGLSEGQRASFERKILVSVAGKNGALEEGEGPAWGTPECREFWKPVCEGLKQRMAKLKITGELMLGIGGDYTPSRQAVGDLKEASGGARWVRQTHSSVFSVGSSEVQVGYLVSAWGGAGLRDPDFGRCYGWASPAWKGVTREFPGDACFQRVYLEAKTCGVARFPDGKDYGLRGPGRMGADFWPVESLEIKGSEVKKGGVRSTCLVAGRYPETAWGQLNIVLFMPAMFAPGPDGAMHCVRTELFRENLQEVEARIFLEKALTDEARRAKLGAELAARAQELLDVRTRIGNATVWQYANDRSCTMASDLGGLSRQLYELAAEAARKLAE